jgi:hypothetical protein
MHIYYCQGSLKSHISVTGTFQDADLTLKKKKKKDTFNLTPGTWTYYHNIIF